MDTSVFVTKTIQLTKMFQMSHKISNINSYEMDLNEDSCTLVVDFNDVRENTFLTCSHLLFHNGWERIVKDACLRLNEYQCNQNKTCKAKT